MKIFLDTGSIDEIKELHNKVDGFTTNPTLMRKAGAEDYKGLCQEVLSIIGNKPVSFEVFSDDFKEMERQARKLSNWGENIYVKIPIVNTKGESSVDLINKLTKEIKVNVTAVMSPKQCEGINPYREMIISLFAGRVADTGVDPCKLFKEKLNAEYLWASPREVLNVYQAEQSGADIITVAPDILKRYWQRKGQDLIELSIETVKQFNADAKGYIL
jgi:transaldolase